MQGRPERGAALVVTLLGLTLVGALVAAVVVVAADENRQSGQAIRAQRALAAAELGIADQLDQLRRGAAGPATSTGEVSRLNESLYLLDVTAADPVDGSRRRLGLLARTRAPAVALAATLTTRGPLRLDPGVMLAGEDPGASAGDSCPPSGGPVSATRDTASPLEDVDYAGFAARASLHLASGAYDPQPSVAWDGGCDTIVASNWGDGVASSGACPGLRRAVHVGGDATLIGGRGAGLLLVDGDLSIVGPFEYEGLILVRGRLDITNAASSPVSIHGALIAANPAAADQRLAGNVQMSYSNCAVTNALRLMARPTQLQSRAWIQLF